MILTPLTFLGLMPTSGGPTGAEAIQRFDSNPDPNPKPDPNPNPNPNQAIERFEERFEERHGPTHPAFFRGTSSQALQGEP